MYYFVYISLSSAHKPLCHLLYPLSLSSCYCNKLLSECSTFVIFSSQKPYLLHSLSSSNMAVLVLLVLFLAMTGHSSATWCVCKEGADAILQKTLDYACGAGADCGPIHQNGPCYNPNTVRSHCNYAVNSYFQRKGQAQGTCDFAGTATISASDPSSPGCTYLATASATGTTPTTTPVTTNPGTNTTPSTTTTPNTGTTTSPYSTTPSNGVLGGIGNTGVGPSGAGINTDVSHGGFRSQVSYFLTFFITFLFSGLML